MKAKTFIDQVEVLVRSGKGGDGKTSMRREALVAFGGPDGGWAEGMFYASSYTKWYLPFFSAVERFSGASYLKRPFYQRLIRYFQHFCPPNWEIHPFGDGYWCRSDDAEWPLSARTEGNRLVRMKGDTTLIGKFTTAKIVSSNTWALYGEADAT